MNRLVILLDEAQVVALSRLAKQECRNTWQQAAVIIRDELERRGLLPTPPEAAQEPQSQGVTDDSR